MHSFFTTKPASLGNCKIKAHCCAFIGYTLLACMNFILSLFLHVSEIYDSVLSVVIVISVSILELSHLLPATTILSIYCGLKHQHCDLKSGTIIIIIQCQPG